MGGRLGTPQSEPTTGLHPSARTRPGVCHTHSPSHVTEPRSAVQGHPQAQASTPSPKHPPHLLHWPEWHWLFRDVSERLGISWGFRKPSGRRGTLGSGQDSGGLLAVEPMGAECWARRVEEEKSHTPRAHSSPAAGTPTTSAVSYVPCRAPGRGRPLSEARTVHPRGAVRWSTYGRPCLRMAWRGPGTSLPLAPRQGLCSCQQRPPNSSPGRH